MPFLITMPKLSPTMTEGTIARWLKKEGDFVQPGEVILEITSDKSTLEHSSIDEGWIRKILVAEGAVAQLNEPLAILSATKEESIEGFLEKKKEETIPPPEAPKEEVKAAPRPKEEKVPVVSPAEERGERISASPLARKMAQEKGIDLTTIEGSGPGGRIVARDLGGVEKAPAAKEESTLFNQALDKMIQGMPPGTFDEIPLSPMRKVIAHTLQEVKRSIPHFYLSKRINAEAMVVLRSELESKGQKITFNDMIIRASALALKKHPEVNCGFNPIKETLLRYKSVDVSVAVSTEKGLFTPIIKNTDQKSLFQISLEMKSLKEKTLSGNLKEEEYRGGSFTISNLGMYKISEFVAIINPPQAAILAVGAIEDAVLVKNGGVKAGKAMTLTLSCDHRVFDGAVGAQFLQTVASLLENPEELTK